jgi:hypothetical protein
MMRRTPSGKVSRWSHSTKPAINSARQFKAETVALIRSSGKSVPPSYVPDRTQRELRELVRYRTSLVQERSAEVNRLMYSMPADRSRRRAQNGLMFDPDAKRPVELAVHGPLARKERLTAFGGAVSNQLSAFSFQQ